MGKQKQDKGKEQKRLLAVLTAGTRWWESLKHILKNDASALFFLVVLRFQCRIVAVSLIYAVYLLTQNVLSIQ